MIAKLFIVALFSTAFATKQVEDFLLHRNALVQDKFTDEETLRRLTEEAAEKARQVSTRADNVKTEFINTAKDISDALMWQAAEHKRELQQVIKDTVFKGMDKDKGVDTFRCIAERGQDGFKLFDQVEDIIPDAIHDETEKHVDVVMHYKYVVKEFYEYVEAFYQAKSQELKQANSDAMKKKIMKDVMDKMKLLESVLENINSDITDAKSVFFEHLGPIMHSLSSTLWKILYGEGCKIEQCVP